MLGHREPDIYGTQSMEQAMLDLQRRWPDIHFTYRQSNHEGDIIDWLQLTLNIEDHPDFQPWDGIILNPGGYTHTSVSIRDAVALCQIPVVEVHLSNIYAREDFRRINLIRDVVQHSIVGEGILGYQLATEWLIQHTS